MHINELKKQKLLNIFIELAKIPSPSLSEDKVIEWIKEYCKKNNLNFEQDTFGNVIIRVSATDENKKPLLLSAHMDVVGDFSPIKVQADEEYIFTDKTRTLGADNKVGVAAALYLAAQMAESAKISHGGLEIILTKDEEHGMSGIKHVDYSSIESKYALILDADKLGQLLISGASYTNAVLTVKSTYGGHSGLDIGDSKRLNAAVLISELIQSIPQGVYYKEDNNVITSINLGTVIGGNIQNIASKICNDKVESDNYLEYFINNSVTNVINTEAKASYSIRSADVNKEEELKAHIQKIIDEFNTKYSGFASADIFFFEHLPPFQKTDDLLIVNLHDLACKNNNVIQKISSFHAGAETHIYAQNKNKHGENFLPVLVGIADIFNMHSPDEKVNYNSMKIGFDVLKDLFLLFNSNQ